MFMALNLERRSGIHGPHAGGFQQGKQMAFIWNSLYDMKPYQLVSKKKKQKKTTKVD